MPAPAQAFGHVAPHPSQPHHTDVHNLPPCFHVRSRSRWIPACAGMTEGVARVAPNQLRAWASSPHFASMLSSSCRYEPANASTPSLSSLSVTASMVHARLCQSREGGVRLLLRALQCERGDAVVQRGLERVGRHRVHGVGADQVVDIERVGVGGILGARARPERTLHLCAPRLQCGEVVPCEPFLEQRVGGLGVRDCSLALQRRISARSLRALCRPPCPHGSRRTRQPTRHARVRRHAARAPAAHRRRRPSRAGRRPERR